MVVRVNSDCFMGLESLTTIQPAFPNCQVYAIVYADKAFATLYSFSRYGLLVLPVSAYADIVTREVCCNHVTLVRWQLSGEYYQDSLTGLQLILPTNVH